MKKIGISILLLACASGLSAQKKQLAEGQIWADTLQITDPVRRVINWDGDKAILLGGSPRLALSMPVLSADGKTGKITEVDRKSIKSTVRVTEARVMDGGDIFLVTPDGRQTQITASPEVEKNPVLSPDLKYVAFTRNNDLYTIRLSDRKETRLTTDGSDVILNGRASWVYMEEILGRKTDYCTFWWSPDSKHVAFFRSDESKVPVFTVADSPGQNGYLETLRYPKPGNPIPQVKAGVVSPDGGAITWAAVDAAEEHYFALPYWRPDSKALWLQWSNRKQNHLKILEMDLASGQLKQLYDEQQKTWIAIDAESRIRFLESGKGFILTSDKSGWNRLYLHDMNGKLITSLTPDNCTVLDVLRIDEKEKTIYFTCYKDHIACEDFYKVNLDGKALQRLSFGPYTHNISLSDNGKYFVTAYSNTQTPPKVDMYTTKGKFVCRIQDTKRAELDEYERPQVELVTLKSDDGKFDIPMRIVWPLNRQPGKKYPVKISIYGGPNSLRVRDGWINLSGGGTYKQAQDGLILVMLDHRGSGHNGKIGQEYLYRNLGYWEMKDYSQAVRWLVDNKQADPEKIMITGFSYGGYLTSYALTYGADVFTHGIAGGSVTDWMLYDATYTERFMDLPVDNAEGYKKSAVLTYADKLKGKLLLTHGVRDENVHIQNTYQLVSVLEDKLKDFELMVYPESRHGYWGNKLMHSRNLENEFVYRYLLNKPLPEELLAKPPVMGK